MKWIRKKPPTVQIERARLRFAVIHAVTKGGVSPAEARAIVEKVITELGTLSKGGTDAE